MGVVVGNRASQERREHCAAARVHLERHADEPLVLCARGGAPLRRVVARLAGRFVARRGWEALGFVRLGDYARERLGVSARELQDLARVDGRLAELPGIEAAFVAGRLTWTQTRLLCRAATPEDEGRWLARARSVSAAGLAREVRALDRAAAEPATLAGEATDETGAVEEPYEQVRVPCQPRVRARWGLVCALARRMEGAPLNYAGVAERVAAEMVATLGLEVDPESLPAGAAPGSGTAPAAAAVPVLPPPASDATADPDAARFLAPLVEGLAEASPAELDSRLRRAMTLERRRLARLGPMLLELAADAAWRDLGLRSLDQYARERLGMAPRTARALLRLERACRAAPALGRAWRSGALSWSKAQALVALFLSEEARPWQEAWLRRAAAVTLRRLEDDVEHAAATGDFDPEALPALPQPLLPLGVQNGAAPSVPRRSAYDGWPFLIGMPRDVARLFRAALATVRRRLERQEGRSVSPGEALDAMLEHVYAVWLAEGTARTRESRIFERDGWRCVVPGCSSQRNLHAHHIVFRSAGGGNEPANLTTLCAAHHHRGVHGGRIRLVGRAPGALVFDLPTGRYTAGDFSTPAGTP